MITLPDTAGDKDTVLRQYGEPRAQQHWRNTRNIDTVDIGMTLTDVHHSEQRQRQ